MVLVAFIQYALTGRSYFNVEFFVVMRNQLSKYGILIEDYFITRGST